MFIAGLAVVLAEYPRSIVDYAADPRTGVIKKFPNGLPQVGQIAVYLDDVQTRQERLAHYEALPKPQPYRPEPVKFGPNLFVPSGVRRYDEMVKRAQTEPEFARFEDGGVWVPLSWWEGQPDNADALRMAARAAAHFHTHEASGVMIGGQPVSKELAGKLGVGYAEADTAA